MFPEFIDAPDTPTLNINIYNVYTGYHYIHHSLTFGTRTSKVAAYEKKGAQTQNKHRECPPW